MFITKLSVQSESVCFPVEGVFRGKVCISLRIEKAEVKLCVSGEARGNRFEKCFDLIESCVDLVSLGFADAELCITEIEFTNGMPTCARFEIKIDPAFGRSITLLDRRVCFAGIVVAANMEPFETNGYPPVGTVVIVPMETLA